MDKHKIEALLVGLHDTDILGDTSWLNKLKPNQGNFDDKEICVRRSSYTIFNIGTAQGSMTRTPQHMAATHHQLQKVPSYNIPPHKQILLTGDGDPCPVNKIQGKMAVR